MSNRTATPAATSIFRALSATRRPREGSTNTTGEAILDAAVELFAQRGYHATSMREIAAAVPVRAAGIYHWYENKEAILMQLQRAFLDGLTVAVHEAIDAQRRPESRLAAAVRVHVAFHGLHPREAFVTDSEIRALSRAGRRAVMARRDAYEDLFAGLIEDGVRTGRFKVADVRIASYAILLQCTGVALWFDPKGKRSLDEVADIHVELVLGSLGVNRRAIATAVRETRDAAQAAR